MPSRVVVIRHTGLTTGSEPEGGLLRELIDRAACALTGAAAPAAAWSRLVRPSQRLGIKVNCLGLPTSPAAAGALAEALCASGLDPERIVLWDRTDRELRAAGYRLRRSGGVRCFGTDSLTAGRAGYEDEIRSSGRIGSMFSRIVTHETDALVSAAVLKDHNLAGLTGCLKNFFGAIHNPNKYHDDGCDPFIADVCAHPLIRERLRLAFCDAIRPQYHGGPPDRPDWRWPYGGLLLAVDPVALDRVGVEIIARRRAAAGMAPLEAENRPPRHLASARERGLGTDRLEEIEIVSLGLDWEDVS